MIHPQPSVTAIPMQAAISDLDHALGQLTDTLQNLASRLDGALTPAEELESLPKVEQGAAVARSPIVLAIDKHTERVRALNNVVQYLLSRLEI